MRTIPRTASRVVAALFLASCAAAGEAAPGGQVVGEMPVRVTVQNDGTIPVHVRVYLIGAGGAPVQFGTLSTLGTGTVQGSIPHPGTYHLRAEGGTGYALNSPRVSVRPGDELVWDMRRNRVRVERR